MPLLIIFRSKKVRWEEGRIAIAEHIKSVKSAILQTAKNRLAQALF